MRPTLNFKKMLRELKVVNDAAELGVALIQYSTVSSPTRRNRCSTVPVSSGRETSPDLP